MTTHHLTTADAGTYRPDSVGEPRRGMTPEQRRELERLIDEREKAAVNMALARVRGDHSAEDEFKAAYRAVMRYLDEVTDYSRAEVSGS